MASVSGLSERHREQVRRDFLKAAYLLLNHAGEVHYTQDWRRWEGIRNGLLVVRNEFPRHGDCSSTLTWMLWNGLARRYHVRDTVNGLRWAAGYTGTMLNHGKRVRDLDNLKVGDCGIYGPFPGRHVVGYIGGGWWFSHGSEAGPFKVRLNYRGDLNQVRRFI